ncbi:oxidoreductase [Algoriphagus namhaensis]|uniref:Oxidoreductase n=1 Tax=Algoriphagus namhaensis TaxID=915353 RepID=A0ABV8ASL9_9BACT
MRIAILSGTSGLIGMQLLHQLLKNPSYDYIISIGRRELALKHAKLIQLKGDLLKVSDWNLGEMIVEKDLGGEHQDLRSKLESGDCQIDSFCSLGTTIGKAGSKEKFKSIDQDMVLAIASWVKSIGGNQFCYVSALGADSNSGVFYNQVKGQAEDGLKDLNFDYLGIFRPSLLLGERKEFRFGEQVATVLMKPLVWLKVLKNIRPIYDYQVAKAMVQKALDTGKAKGVEIINSGQMQDLTT